MSRFEVFYSSNQFWFRFKAKNGEQILSSEGYLSKQSCLNGINSVKSQAPFDSSYRRIDGHLNYRFNMVGRNYEIIARSSEGYTTAYNRDHAIEVVKTNAPSAPVYDLT